MSRNNSSRAYQIQNLIKQVQESSPEELYTLHWIELNEDGSVYDNCYGKLFDDVSKWAVFNIEMEEHEESYDSAGYGGEYED